MEPQAEERAENSPVDVETLSEAGVGTLAMKGLPTVVFKKKSQGGHPSRALFGSFAALMLLSEYSGRSATDRIFKHLLLSVTAKDVNILYSM